MPDKYSWFKVDTNIHFDPKIRRLAPSDRWYFVVVCAMTNDGTLFEPEGLREELMMEILQLTEEELQGLKNRLLRVRLIGEDWIPVQWDRWQTSKDKTNAERQRRFRDRQREKAGFLDNDDSNALRNGGVTRYVTLPEEEEEEEKEEEREGEESAVSALPQAEDAPAPAKRVNYQEIVDLYHEILPNHPKVKVLTEARKRHIRKLALKNLPDLEHWRKFFNAITRSDFLSGRVEPRDGRRPFIADLDFLIKPDKYVKILEGRYHE